MVAVRCCGVNETHYPGACSHVRVRPSNSLERLSLALHNSFVVSPQAAGANVHLLGLAVSDDSRTLYVRKPPCSCALVRVTDVVAGLTSLITQLTSCHFFLFDGLWT